MNALLVAILVAGAVYFTVNWFYAAQAVRGMTEVQRRQVRIDDETRKQSRVGLSGHVAGILRRYGWPGDLTPALLLATFCYLTCAVALSVIGLDGVVGAALALPASFGVATMAAGSFASKRRRLFHQQLVQALDLLSSQLRAGVGPNRAIEMVLPSLPDPLRSELGGALDQSRATRPLADAVADVGIRYPSRAMSMFVAALRIDQAQAGRITDSLEQAAASVRKDFELNAEAMAEISQDKAQFFGILGIVGLIMAYSFSRNDPQTRGAFLSPLGISMLSLGAANFGFGIWRVMRVFRKARGEY